MTENSPSQTVAATPLTAQKGDANGSMSVDVADVVTEISYLTGGNPQPFIFEAADVNNDNTVNILDVVGTINIILAPSTETAAIQNDAVIYYIEDGILYIETEQVLGGVQFSFTADADNTFEALAALDGFERIGQWQNENTYLFMAYSMSGKTLAIGKHALLRIGNAELTNIVLSDPRGNNIVAIARTATGLNEAEKVEAGKPYPNPFTREVHIPFAIAKAGLHQVTITIHDVIGNVVSRHNDTYTYGNHEYIWHAPAAVATGIYFVEITIDRAHIGTHTIIHNHE